MSVKHSAPNAVVKKKKRTRAVFLRDEAGAIQKSLHEMPSGSMHENADQAFESMEMGRVPVNFTEYLLCPIIGHTPVASCESSEFVTSFPSPVNPSSQGLNTPGPISPRLLGRLMGKSPLRLVAKREAHFPPPGSKLQWNEAYSKPTHWAETLECGHTQDHLFDLKFLGGETLSVIPCAKRRRCQECKAIEQASLFLPPKKPVQSVSSEEIRKRGTK